jgi:hypothetical protein
LHEGIQNRLPAETRPAPEKGEERPLQEEQEQAREKKQEKQEEIDESALPQEEPSSPILRTRRSRPVRKAAVAGHQGDTNTPTSHAIEDD